MILLGSSGIAQTHSEKASSPDNLWSDQRLMPRGNKGAGFTPGLSPHRLSGSTAQDKSKPLAKSNTLFSQAGTSSKESPFLICLFWVVHSLSKPFLALVVQTEPPDLHCQPKYSSAFASALCQHCHGYIIVIIPTYTFQQLIITQFQNKPGIRVHIHPNRLLCLRVCSPANAGVSWAFTPTAWVKRWAK